MRNKYKNYNRYCHQRFYLTKGENKIELLTPDSVNVYVDVDTIKRMHIRYLVFKNCEPEAFVFDGLQMNKVFVDGSVNVYETVFA